MFAPNWITPTGLALSSALGLATPCALAQQPDNVYSTYSMHHPPSDSPCTFSSCLDTREPRQPTDTRYRAYWSSNWTMYGVFNGYVEQSAALRRRTAAGIEAGAGLRNTFGRDFLRQHLARPQPAKAP